MSFQNILFKGLSMQILANTAGNKSKPKYCDCVMQTSQEDKARLLCCLPQKKKKNRMQKEVTSLRSLEQKFDSSLVEHTTTKCARIVPASLNFEFDEELLSNPRHICEIVS